jgi:hypothetical protein
MKCLHKYHQVLQLEDGNEDLAGQERLATTSILNSC